MKVKSITYQLLSRCIDAVVCTECIKSSALPDLTKPNQTKPNAWCLASSIATTLYHTLVHCYSFFCFIIAFKTLLVVLSITFDLSSSWIFYLLFFSMFFFCSFWFFSSVSKVSKKVHFYFIAQPLFRWFYFECKTYKIRVLFPIWNCFCLWHFHFSNCLIRRIIRKEKIKSQILHQISSTFWKQYF